MRLCFLAALSLGLFVSSSAQVGVGIGAGKAAASGTPSFAAEPFVIEHLDWMYRMQADGTGVREKTLTVAVQSQSALKDLAVLSMQFASKSERVDWVYARLRHQDGSMTETPVAGALEQTEPVTREAPFYSDLKDSQLPLKDLRVGDTIEMKVRVVRTQAEAVNEFWGEQSFVHAGVVRSETLTLDVPAGKTVTVWSPKLPPADTTEGARRLYRWQWTSLKPTVGPVATAAAEAEAKRVRTPEEELDTRQGKLPDVAWTTFASWEAVGAWYRGLEGQRTAPSAEIKAKVTQLTAGKATQLEKVQAVYDYVATQIHYIGVAFGVGRYQPHAAGDVLDNQYGDCKDKHTLLASMLEALGLDPDAVLIGVEIRFNRAAPSPAAFNHLITQVTLEGKPVWLDTTAEVAPFGMLTYPTRDHEALVVPDVGVAKVERTPAAPAIAQVTTMSSDGALDAEGTSKSRITLTFRGDSEVVMRSVLRQISSAQYDELAQRMCASMGYGGKASNLETSRAEETSSALTMSFDYKREKTGDWDNLRTVAQLTPVGLPRPDEKEPPVEAIQLGPPQEESSKAAMKLPDGWGAELPEARHVVSAWATLDETYRLSNGVLYSERKLVILKDHVAQADWKSYSKFAEKADLGNEQMIQLTRKGVAISPKDGRKSGVSNAPALVPGGAESDPAKLVEQGYEVLQQHNLVDAQALFDRVKAINPEQPRLWGCYGDLALRRGEISEAITDYQKELALHPSAVQVYPVLINSELAVRRRAEALTDVRRWIEAAPNRSEPYGEAATLEMEEGSIAAALETLARGLKAAPSDRLKLQLGKTQLQGGHTADGQATLVALIGGTEDPGMRNDAAYELADAKVELPLADRTIHKALEQMEASTRTWTLDENAQTLRAQTRLLQAAWDTMGWVDFREGKLDEAERYIAASWRGRQSATVGQHLGMIEEALGYKTVALETYELALAAEPQYDGMGVRREPSPEQKAIEEQIKALRNAKVQSTRVDGRAELQRMRTLKLANGDPGVAEYKLLVSSEGVQRVEAADDKTVTGAVERLKEVKFAEFVPAGSKAQLMFLGIVTCGTHCEVILEP